MLLEERLLKRLREEKRQWEQLLLEDRPCVQDFATYRFFLGKILGLNQAIALCIDAFGKDPHDDA